MGEMSNTTTVYICPVHADVKLSSPGRCTKCGMVLMPENNGFAPRPHGTAGTWNLVAIVGILVTLATAVMMFMR